MKISCKYCDSGISKGMTHIETRHVEFEGCSEIILKSGTKEIRFEVDSEFYCDLFCFINHLQEILDESK